MNDLPTEATDTGSAAPELQRLRLALQAAETRAAEAEKELGLVSYAISHDLRAPLRAVNGFAEILLEDYAGQLDEQAQHYLKTVCDNARKMNRYLEALLDLSRISRREMNPVLVEMTGLIGAVMEEARQAAAGRPVELALPPLPAVTGDPAMLRELFAELVGNAFKSTRSREHPLIRVAGRREGEEVIYSVSDNGIGFDAEYADRLFGLFQKLHGQEEFEGEGCGLARVRRLAARHGGRAWGEGVAAEGATFFVALPATGPEEAGSG